MPAAGDLKGAADAWQQLVAVRTSQFGADHWQVTDARLGWENVQLQINMTDEQRARLAEAYNLVQTVSQLYSQQKFPEALVAARQVVDIRREILGEDHTDLAKGLVDLAALLDLTGEAGEAESLRQQALDICRKVLGDQHPDYALFLTQLAYMSDKAGDNGTATKLYEQALAIYTATLGADHAECRLAHERLKDLYQRVAVSRLETDDLEAARQVRQQVLDLEIKRFGEDHWRTTDARLDLKRIETLAGLDAEKRSRLSEATGLTLSMFDLYREGRAAEAVALAAKSLAARREILGETHIDTGESLNNLGAMNYGAGDYDKAEPLYQQALQIRREELGPTHPLYSTSLNNLALLYHRMGHYGKAKPLYQEALRWNEQSFEHRPADYAQSLKNLANLYRDMGDTAHAEPLYDKAAEDRREELGEDHPLYAASLHDLALLYHATDRRDQAEVLWKQAIEILKQAEPVGKRREYAQALTSLASLYHDQGKFDEAGQFYQQALEIRREILGEQHADYAVSLGNLAAHYRSTGRFDEAESLYEQALEILKAQFGEDHHVYANMLRNLARLHESRGDPDKAEPLLRQSLEIAREKLEQMAAIQSERQQLAMAVTFRDILDLYLSLCARADLPADEAYVYVLRWKGAVFARQHELRSHRRMLQNSNDPEMAGLIDDLEHTACRIATLALSVPPPDQRQARWRQLGELTRHKEELEAGDLPRSASNPNRR